MTTAIFKTHGQTKFCDTKTDYIRVYQGMSGFSSILSADFVVLVPSVHTLGSVKVFWVAFRVSLGLFDCNRVFHFSPFCKVCYVSRCCTFICHTKLILCTTVINYTRKALEYYSNKCTDILNEASHIFSILYMLMKWFTCSLTYLSIIF